MATPHWAVQAEVEARHRLRLDELARERRRGDAGAALPAPRSLRADDRQQQPQRQQDHQHPIQARRAAPAPDPGPRLGARFLTQAGHSQLAKLGMKACRWLRLHLNQFQT
jgi:hypothetical protein